MTDINIKISENDFQTALRRTADRLTLFATVMIEYEDNPGINELGAYVDIEAQKINLIRDELCSTCAHHKIAEHLELVDTE